MNDTEADRIENGTPRTPEVIPDNRLTPERLFKLRALYAAQPDRWLKSVTGESVWWKQQEIMRSVAANPRVSVASCNSSGKSFLASRLVLWFLNVYSPAIVITTAPTNRQVEKILWREIQRGYMAAAKRGIVIGEPPLTTEWKLDANRYAIGFSPREYDPDAFQGFHALNMLIIVDEAAQIDDDIRDGIDSVVRGSHYHILEISNPTAITGRYYQSFQKAGWINHTISAFDSPNVLEQREVVPGLIGQKDIDDCIQEYGEDSWQYKVFILGQFPDKEEGTLIALDWLSKAADRTPDPERLKNGSVQVGADIARFGSDAVTFVAQRGGYFFADERHTQKTTMESTGLLANFADRVNASIVRIDTVGLGAGVVDRYREIAPKHIEVVEMIGSSKAKNPLKYANAVTEWWDHLANLLKGGIASGPIFENRYLIGDLVSRKAKMLSNGLLMLESKDDLKKRLHRSPDFGDATVMAAADGIEGVGKQKRLRVAWARK